MTIIALKQFGLIWKLGGFRFAVEQFGNAPDVDPQLCRDGLKVVAIGHQKPSCSDVLWVEGSARDLDFVEFDACNRVQDHSHSSFCLGEDGYARQGVFGALCRNHRGWLRPFSGCVGLLLRGDSDSQATKSSSLVGFHRNMLCRSHDLRVALGQSAGHVPARDTLQVIPSHSSFRSRVMCHRTACRSIKPVAAATSPGGAAVLRPAGFFQWIARTLGRVCHFTLERHTGGAWRPDSVPPTSLLDLRATGQRRSPAFFGGVAA